MPHYKNFRAVVYCTAQSMVRISPEGLQRQIGRASCRERV